MKEEFVSLQEDVSASPLYSEDLAPVPAEKRTWNTWHLAFVWVGMAVCIPTYMMAAFMIKAGMSWYASLIVIGLANLVITIPMVLNGHAGVKYGIPFPVLGRAAFGIHGIHLPAILRAIVACGWFGIQTWLGGLACYAIWNAATGNVDPNPNGLNLGEFGGFSAFWVINMYFVWKGTESIKWLEEYSAPILIAMGIALIIWGTTTAGGFGIVLDQSKQLEQATIVWVDDYSIAIHPIKHVDGSNKATAYQMDYGDDVEMPWENIAGDQAAIVVQSDMLIKAKAVTGTHASVMLRTSGEDGKMRYSRPVVIDPQQRQGSEGAGMLWTYLLAFTGMVGFWATMSLSIADITRFTKTQKAQVRGQFLGLPGTMMLYSFVGIFVTCAAVVNFKDILVAEDAPWDPVSLLSRFENPVIVILAQIMMLIATLSTNIAANVIAPANAFSNLSPKRINFKTGGTITGIVGILICPWWLMDDISPALVFVSGLLGPVLGIMIADYYVVRKKELQLAELFKLQGAYTYAGGFNMTALVAMSLGIIVALVGYFVPAVDFLYKLSWFTGFGVAFLVYVLGMKRPSAIAHAK
jgi:cytosine/uracil/thiamine/allantoin permease